MRTCQIRGLASGGACVLIGALLWVASGETAVAQATEPGQDEWRFTATSYLWATSLNGEIGAKGTSTDVDASFKDVLQESDSLIGIEGRLAVEKGDWGVYLDGIYNRIGADENDNRRFLSLDSDATMTLAIAEAAVFYSVGTWTLPFGPDTADGERPTLTLQPYAGARYTYLDIDLDLDLKLAGRQRHAQADDDRHWVDPIVGSRVLMDITERWQVMIGGDVGGFGVGSDFTWSALGVVGYGFEMFGLRSQAAAGYRALHQDYEDGNGSDEFKWDMTLHGPIIGFVTRF